MPPNSTQSFGTFESRTRDDIHKLTWHVDERFCWRFDHQIHILNQLSALGSGGRITLPMNMDFIFERWECVCKLAYSRQEEKNQALFWANHSLFYRRIKAAGAARRTFFSFHTKKAFILQCSQEALVNLQARVSNRLGGFLEKAAWPLPGNLTSIT